MRKGFTLLEMVVVLLIGALILLVSIPNIKKTIDIAQTRSCQSQLKLVDAAIVQYFILYDEFPDGIDQLVAEELLSEKQASCSNGSEIIISDGKAELEAGF